MRSEPWDLVALTIDHARHEGFSSATYQVLYDYVAEIWVEWNGGLPIIGYKDLNTGATFHDVTASALVRFLESCESKTHTIRTRLT